MIFPSFCYLFSWLRVSVRVYLYGMHLDTYEYSEVYRALIRIRGLYTRYREVGNSNTVESVWITNELRNSLRTLEWDLEDLEDTINILFKNFNLIQFLTIWSSA